MIENPFIVTEKVIPQYFCDREKETAQLTKLLENGNNVVLISKRRIGKTGLIQYCFEQPDIKANFLTIYIDILSTTNLKEFIYLLGQEIFNVVKTKGEKIWRNFLMAVKSISGKIGFDPISGTPTLNLQLGDIVQPEHTLKEIFQYISKAEKPCIVAIDEFQQITKYPERNVEALIRSHLLQINNCRMIFSGSERHLLENMFMHSSRPFYSSASFLELGPIPKDKYVEFIIRLFEERKKIISRDIVAGIYDMFRGVTFYIQRVCNGLFANTPVAGRANEAVLTATIEEILYSFDYLYRLRLSTLTTRQKELLFAIAKEGIAEKITSVEFIQHHSLTSSSVVQSSLKALMKNSFVEKSEKGYSIEDIFFRLWLNKNY